MSTETTPRGVSVGGESAAGAESAAAPGSGTAAPERSVALAPGSGTAAAPEAPAAPSSTPAVSPSTPRTPDAPPAAPSSTPSAPTPPASRPRTAGTVRSTPWGVSLVVLVAGMFMSVLDISIVNVAIPTIQNDFGATTEDIQWVSTAYSLAEGVIVPASAWLGLRFGLGRSYVWALVLFTIGSVMCGLAWDLNSMIAFRIVQAIPGGVIPVVALTMLYRVVPREKIGAAMGMYGLGIVVAPAVGPTLGGYLVEYVDWRLIFFINVPVGVLGVIAAMVYLPSFASARAHRFDVPGFLAIATGLFALLLALSKATDWGWTSYPTLILITYSLLALALFVVIELEVAHPLLDVRVFAVWAYTNSLVIIAVISMGLFGVLFFIPQSLQGNQGLGAYETGLVLLPQALVMAVIMPFAGRLYDRFGARWPAVTGLAITAYGTYLLHGLNIDTPHSQLGWILAMRAGGVALAMMPVMTGGMSSLPPERVDGASAYNTVVQRASSAIGLAALTALMTGLQAQGFADRTAVMPSTGGSGSGSAGGSAAGSGGSSAGGSPAGSGAGSSMGSGGSGSGGSGAGGSVLEQYSQYKQVQIHVFDTAFDNLMLATTALTLVALVLAFMLPSGRPTAAGPRPTEA